MFDRVMVINLRSRPDRWKSLQKRWPKALRQPTLIEAFDGNNITKPANFKGNGAQFGNLLTHLKTLRLASYLTPPEGSALILEDDVVFRRGFDTALAQFHRDVPTTWEAVMLGGQHALSATPVSPGVVRCVETYRTHAYAVIQPQLRPMARALMAWSDVTDGATSRIFAALETYAPRPWLCGQAAGPSDISTLVEPERYWDD